MSKWQERDNIWQTSKYRWTTFVDKQNVKHIQLFMMNILHTQNFSAKNCGRQVKLPSRNLDGQDVKDRNQRFSYTCTSLDKVICLLVSISWTTRVISLITLHNAGVCVSRVLERVKLIPVSDFRLIIAVDDRVNDQVRRFDLDKTRAIWQCGHWKQICFLIGYANENTLAPHRAGMRSTCSAGTAGIVGPPEETARKGERIEAGSVRIDSIDRRPIRGGLFWSVRRERRNRRARARVCSCRSAGKQSKWSMHRSYIAVPFADRIRRGRYLIGFGTPFSSGNPLPAASIYEGRVIGLDLCIETNPHSTSRSRQTCSEELKNCIFQFFGIKRIHLYFVCI